MSRLIDADAYKEVNAEILDCEIDHPKYQDTLRELIDNAPTIEIPHSEDWARYSDALWKNAYERGKAEAEPKILDDGTLAVKVKDGGKVGRVLVEGENHFGGLYYLDDEPKQGEWKQISPARIYECSECGQNVMTGDIDVYKFCHGCGAKMHHSGEATEMVDELNDIPWCEKDGTDLTDCAWK